MRLMNKMRRSPSGNVQGDFTPPGTPMTPGTPAFDTESSPFMRPADVNVRHFSGVFGPGVQKGSRGVLPKTTVEKPLLPEASKETPPEMLPVLSQLAAHNVRPYHEGYFMMLSDLNHDGKAPANRQWEEVFGTLRGAQLATWNADELERKGGDTAPHYINIDDASFKSVSTLPSPGGELSNIIVLSTTMKNRYLLQFSTPQMYQTWTAALRLAMFERMSLQEAYTGALLSCKGTKLNGIRSLLGPTKVKRDGWCSVRFGAGMPWRRVWVVATPGPLLTAKEQKQANIPGERDLSKKERVQYGRVAFYENMKNLKKPLAVIVRAHSAYAIFPEKTILMDMSSLLKIEGHVIFAGEEKEPKLSIIHVMPDPRPCIQGFEVLIRFLIPVFDVFNLYGRPQRLNADKADMRSLLFAMPTLPHIYYCDKTDVQMLLSQSDWEHWDSKAWMEKIRELLARKLATGFRGLGSIHDFANDRASIGGASSIESRSNLRAARAVSQPGRVIVPNLTSSQESLPRSVESQSVPSNPSLANSNEPLIKDVSSESSSSSFGKPRGPMTMPQPAGQRPTQVYPRVAPSARAAPAPPTGAGGAAATGPIAMPQPASELAQPKRPTGSRPMPGHERSQSEGQNPNTLIIAPGNGPLTPMLNQSGWEASENRESTLSVAESYQSASDSLDKPTGSSTSVNVFDPGYRPPAATAVPGEPKVRPKHTSYAQYADYMQTYIPGEAPVAGGRPTLLEISKSDVASQPNNAPPTPVNVLSPPLAFDSPDGSGRNSPTSATPPGGFQSPYGARTYGSHDSLPGVPRPQQQRRPSGPRDPAAQLQQSPQHKYPQASRPQPAQPGQPAQVFGQLLNQMPNQGQQRNPYAQQSSPQQPRPQAQAPSQASPGQGRSPYGQPPVQRNPYAQNPYPNGQAPQGYPVANSNPYASKQSGAYPRPMQHSQESLGRRAPGPQGPPGPQGMPVPQNGPGHVYAQPQPRPPANRQAVPSSPSRRPVGKQAPPAYGYRSDGPYAAVGRSNDFGAHT